MERITCRYKREAYRGLKPCVDHVMREVGSEYACTSVNNANLLLYNTATSESICNLFYTCSLNAKEVDAIPKCCDPQVLCTKKVFLARVMPMIKCQLVCNQASFCNRPKKEVL